MFISGGYTKADKGGTQGFEIVCHPFRESITETKRRDRLTGKVAVYRNGDWEPAK